MQAQECRHGRQLCHCAICAPEAEERMRLGESITAKVRAISGNFDAYRRGANLAFDVVTAASRMAPEHRSIELNAALRAFQQWKRGNP